MIEITDRERFEAFFAEVEPKLRRALAGHLPPDLVPDGVAEAMTYAWQNWNDLKNSAEVGGLLFRVAQSRVRQRRTGLLPGPDPMRLPHVEPRLGPAMRRLPPKQRSAVWLVHACGWTYQEAAVALNISASAVGTHLTRAMTRLRSELGADA
jgi:DNA-directed RNA polymerase specialized sigma24 family protein